MLDSRQTMTTKTMIQETHTVKHSFV